MKEKLGQKIYKISGIFGAYARAYKSKVDQPVVVVKKKVVEGRRKRAMPSSWPSALPLLLIHNNNKNQRKE